MSRHEINGITFEKISWERFIRDIHQLAALIDEAHIPLTKIIAISRGGLIPARILSDLLNLPLSYLTISSYSDFQQTHEPTVKDIPPSIFAHDSVLIVDELADTGRTFERAEEYLASLPHASYHTAAVYQKPHSAVVPTFCGPTIDAWIVLPYEVRETFEALSKELKSDKKAHTALRTLGFEEWELKNINIR